MSPDPPRRSALKRLESGLRTLRGLTAPSARRAYRGLLDQRLADSLPADARWVLLDIRSPAFDGPQGRLIHALYTLFERSGFKIAFRARRTFLSNFGKRPLKALLLQRDFRIVASAASMPAGYWYASDRVDSRPHPGAAKVVQLLREGPLSQDADFFAMPFPLFPAHYESGADLEVTRYRDTARHWRLFFGGSTTRKSYTRSSVSEIYGKVGRARIIDLLKQTVPPERLVVIDSESTLAGLLEGYFDGVVVIDGQAYRAPADRWLELVAASDCFLAPPGVSRPMSHNLVEALAVGVPPLNEYPEYFEPPLVSGHESINYTGEPGFVAALAEVMSMPLERLREQGRRAADYYDAHLRYDRFVRKIERCPQREVRLHVAPHEQPRPVDAADAVAGR